jgi:Trp operon repressor
VEQQLNQAFTNILETITAERNGLESLLGLNTPNQEDDDISMVRANTQLSDVNGNQRLIDDQIGSSGRHDNVRKLAAKGLSARKISKELKISISEVELILSLREK